MLAFPLNWSVPLLKDFNSTPIFIEPEIDSLIILRTIEPLGRSINDVLTDDALVSAGIGHPYDMSADKFTEDFIEELARKNTQGQRKRRRDHSSGDLHLLIPICNLSHPNEKVTEDFQVISSCLDWEVVEASKDRSPESLERSIMVDERWILSLKKTDMINNREVRVIELERSLQEREDLLQQSGNKVRTLEETIDLLLQELVVNEEIAVEEYKRSEEYMTNVGMVGVRSRDMAFKRSREWLSERFLNTDFSGAPFMLSVDDDDDVDDEDDRLLLFTNIFNQNKDFENTFVAFCFLGGKVVYHLPSLLRMISSLNFCIFVKRDIVFPSKWMY
ncbi:hypothetical protein Adt_46088 [Abeliophyllum distichum]|uniref:Uncharacterized protein n=1 Tax=Abeliophyllum distichum TaxID=126358 RepID=A0ABD1P2M2_9LAMI